ncbi:DNA/RNA helicase domain-containing protein [Undibacterium sp. Rencai35W]|uniref:DNA/RNA helicase domain-containing protein n=1 Tax=Undibacterium sp. Rencai35W TaxID=3413046 RepID=UPI003BF15DF5
MNLWTCPNSVSRNAHKNIAVALRAASAAIQNIHKFRDEYIKDQSAPVEHVVIFDEAQRSWDQENTSKFMTTKRGQKNFSQSEPEFLISVMDRHADWCAIVALIGGGQEINTGEAGLQGCPAYISFLRLDATPTKAGSALTFQRHSY